MIEIVIEINLFALFSWLVDRYGGKRISVLYNFRSKKEYPDTTLDAHALHVNGANFL